MSVVTGWDWFHPDVPLYFSVITCGHSPPRESAMTGNDMSPMPPLVVAVETETLHPLCESAAVCWVIFRVGSISSTTFCPRLVSMFLSFQNWPFSELWTKKNYQPAYVYLKMSSSGNKDNQYLEREQGMIWPVKRPCSSLSPLFFSSITEYTTTGGLISSITMLVTCTEQSGISHVLLQLCNFVFFDSKIVRKGHTLSNNHSIGGDCWKYAELDGPIHYSGI